MLIMGITYGIVWTTGVGRLDLSNFSGPLTLSGVLNFAVSFGVGLVAALAEEIGWRGYLLPNLVPVGRVRALLLSGFMHGLWHLPLMLLTPFYHAEGNRLLVAGLFLLTLTAAGLYYGYLRLVSESVWPATLAHSVLNTVWTMLTMITIPVASPLLLAYLAGESGIITLIGVAVVSAWLVYRMPRRDVASKSAAVLVGRTVVLS
jgi:membrane protease YdiL (CAAX protease family)